MTQTLISNYKPTFMEKLLGRNYKWWFLLKYQIKHNTFYRTSTLIWMVGRLTILLSTILIWWINIQAGSNLYEFRDIFTYYIFGTMISVGNGVQWNIADRVKSGSMSVFLLSPTPVMPRIIFSDFGWWLFPTCVEIILLSLAALIGREYIIFSNFSSLILYILCGVLGYFISVFFAYILGSLAFFLVEVGGILGLQNQFTYFFAGKAIPLNIVSFLQPLVFLPFAFTFYHPMQIYLGKYSPEETLLVFAGGIVWCLVLYFIAKLIFKSGLKRNEAVGL